MIELIFFVTVLLLYFYNLMMLDKFFLQIKYIFFNSFPSNVLPFHILVFLSFFYKCFISNKIKSIFVKKNCSNFRLTSGHMFVITTNPSLFAKSFILLLIRLVTVSLNKRRIVKLTLFHELSFILAVGCSVPRSMCR